MQLLKMLSILVPCLLVPLASYGLNAQEISQNFISKAPEDPLPTLLDGTLQPKFVNQLVNVAGPNFIFKPHGTTKQGIPFYKIKRKPFMANLGIVDSSNTPLYTPMFGYTTRGQKPTFPGKTFVVDRNKPIKVLWKNKLISRHTGLPIPLPQYVPADQTIHIATPTHPPYPQSGVPTIVHLHGGFTKASSDGYPEAWYTPDFAQKGPQFKEKVFTYSNAQEGTLLWYHDHTLGFTRLNNYVGLVGAYVLRDNLEKSLIRKNKIPSGRYEVPLVITDKMFTSDGQLFFPYTDPSNPSAPIPTVLPEFFGDFMLVNGKAWPFLNVEPREYRLRILNGCDSRFLDLYLMPQGSSSGIPFYQIGTDQGLLSSPVQISHLLIAPGQRADLVVDFSHNNHQTLILTNTAPAPFPDGDPVNPLSTGVVMSFNVINHINTHNPLSHVPHKLRCKPIKRLQPTAPNRQVLLFEGLDQFSRVTPTLGTPQLGSLMWHDPITEKPLLGSTEIWEIYNTTADSHPIHLHAGAFQILDRQYFSGTLDPLTGVLTNIVMLGDPIPPLPAEEGWFDTTIVPPASGGPVEAIGQRTRIIMKFGLPGLYVWHCHILSHEDHDMMRPMLIQKKAL